GQGLLVLRVRVHQVLPAAHRPGNVVELPAAHPLFFQVHHLEADAPLLKIALGLFGVEALAGAEDLDIHAFAVLSGFVPALVPYRRPQVSTSAPSGGLQGAHLRNRPAPGRAYSSPVRPTGGNGMKAIGDPNLCIACTQCAGLCPEGFSMDGTLAVAIAG